jgi:hypothetical protein
MTIYRQLFKTANILAMKSLLLLVVFLGTTVAVIKGQNQSTPNRPGATHCVLTETDYAVFTGLIKGLGGPEDPEEAWTGKELLVMSITAGPGSPLPTAARIENGWGFRSTSKDAPGRETAEDFLDNSGAKCALSSAFAEGKSYSLLNQNVLDTAFKKGHDGWDKFYKLYPKAAGYWTFSRPGYNATGDEALLYVGHHCGWLCGTGHLYLLRKQASDWVVVNRQMLWIS